MASRLSFADLPFMQSTQQGNPSGVIPAAYASGSIGNMLYTAAASGVAGNSLSLTHQLSQFPVPSLPSAATFSGPLRTCGTGGQFATLTAAIAASSAGDRIQVLPGTVTEVAAVAISKSLEIFGTGANCIVRRDSTTQVLSITAANVYVHDLRVWNNQLASTDAAGLSSCITASTMQQATQNGLAGIYIANCTFTFPKMGVSIDAASWVVRDCTFNSNSATPGATIRALTPYGSTGSSFISGNTFNAPASQGNRMICIAPNAAGPRGATFVTGYTGDLVIQNNTLAGNTVRAYIDTTGMFRAPGAITSLYTPGQFNFYLKENNFGSFNYTSSPVLFYVSAGAYTGSSPINPWSFFGIFYAAGNSFGKSTTGTEKGALFFTAAAAPTSGGRGTFQTGFYAASNSIAVATLASPNLSALDAAYSPQELLVVDTTFYATAPKITPSTPAGAMSVSVSGSSATVSVPTNTSATSLAAFLNADVTFAANVAASASDGGNASTSGSVTLSGGAG